MNDVERFTVTPEHVALLRAAYVGWDSCEFGAPAIDCKRPYGNSDVLRDMAGILNVPQVETEDGSVWSKAEAERMRCVHAETRTALQIFLRTGTMEPGTYKAPFYTQDWQRV
jgi:hypothetical protein